MTEAAQPLRLAFMGTPDFAVPALAALLDAGHMIAAVYTQPQRPADRGLRERRSAVHQFAEDRRLTVRAPHTFNDQVEIQTFSELGVAAAVVVAYGLILPPPILSVPRLGCINIHASLLPRWRGAAPIQRAIMAGDRETGITIMQMDAGLDTGPGLLREAVPITGDATGGSLHDALATLGARLIVQTLDGCATGRLAAVPQTETGMTYAAKLRQFDCRLDWTRSASDLECQVRALFPAPGAWCKIGGARVKVLEAEPRQLDVPTGAPGTVLDDALTVACGSGSLRLIRIQKAGRKPMDAAAYLHGNPTARGTLLK